MSSAKWHPFCLGLNVLIFCRPEEDNSRMALLMVVLSDIFMHENVVTDGESGFFISCI